MIHKNPCPNCGSHSCLWDCVPGPKTLGVDVMPEWWARLTYDGMTGLNLQDHQSFSKDGEEVYWEPYAGGPDNFKQLADFCDKHNLDFVVTGGSAWNPGHTFLVILRRKAIKSKQTRGDNNAIVGKSENES